MIEAIAARDIIACACDCIVVFMHVAVSFPLFKKEVVGFLREFRAHFRSVVITKAQVDQIIHRPPNAAAPVFLISKGGVIPRNRGNHPLTPEFLGIEEVLFDHNLGLLRRCRFGKERIEVSGRQARTELPGVQVLVEKDA